ncbi:bifunctional proline dehydrogenase/L-glutamate gamma-semialdehyde dehydrogenase PutA [Spiribacter vilamensis]|uniref:Bifunctional protein PutA n=1 Tax=Spiribacter vilamensis TaxID=531306 RepID=A0A4Q8D1U2_9GAMM|nr:bifunctional proline dehydrogenase/L-glutamate gamma-semialdehyde dehydrogenase PutA [Spiribacter vilamensis]RZU99371.1 L-proline dehydrogenase /delta-1-pyrroline-5-carboxylate dehydrogenase [Spiribacter vilamensis]TVO61649.1 bifunctional proline dehydrogenase/L-glutamate gamma-semialdehyde dehydrogenase PutA [Spiribacter vilamensis]
MDTRISALETDRPVELPAALTHGMRRSEITTLQRLVDRADLAPEQRQAIVASAADLVREIRQSARPGLMEVFLAEYGLSTDEGIALMCLAEALLRVPDAPSIDALIEDKIRPSDWGQHMGHSSSSLVNASTWALMLTGRILDNPSQGVTRNLRGAVKRLGEPVIRTAVGRAMREMGRQFVLGESIEAALKRARGQEKKGFTYSYDMLGEAARTAEDAKTYYESYRDAIIRISNAAQYSSGRDNPGISVKLSALHPRYELAQRDRVLDELVPRVTALARLAAEKGLGFNIDAEESDRLNLSLEVAEAVLQDPATANWDGFGMVIQAYGQRAADTVDWLYQLAQRLDRQMTLRLVKGAYWDTEIKRAQALGLDGFPVFTRKAGSDVSYLAVSRQLLGMTDRLYPQFATHNAHSVAAVLAMAEEMQVPTEAFEFQRLHGMGERLHDIVRHRHGTRCRIYAPVGEHRDLLAYLVRRLLENGANSSFVNQIVDENVPPETVVACPFEALDDVVHPINPKLANGPEIFLPSRRNARGFDLGDLADLDCIEGARRPFRDRRFQAAPVLGDGTRSDAGTDTHGGHDMPNPADPDDLVGHVRDATAAEVEQAIGAALPWTASARERAGVLERAAELYERDFGEILAIVAREAGKNMLDAVGELREAIDFLYYYARQCRSLEPTPRGRFACISPWNFPLAIFTGQIAGALAAGNAVLAKPAEQSPLTAAKGIALMHEAGVPASALQFLPGDGATVGAALTGDERIDGVAFTGGTDTARAIHRNMRGHLDPGAPLIAETGGLNAMIVDSTALHEQAVRDVIASAFQSAGQRCSALRCLYIQEDVHDDFMRMLLGAMDELRLGNPWQLSTDVGPVIDADAAADIQRHVDTAKQEGRLIKQVEAPNTGYFVGPAVIRVDGIDALEREIFGPVLHVATYRADALDGVIEAINARGYGLTFGVHTRIEDRVQHIVDRVHAGNLYVNRNQIGAIVGSQPFGGEGLSGTGPKAGGPDYVKRFAQATAPQTATEPPSATADPDTVQQLLDATPTAAMPAEGTDMPGPTGESNRLYHVPRAPLLCLGPGAAAAAEQRRQVEALGGVGIEVTGQLNPEALGTLNGFAGVIWWGDADAGRALASALARRDGEILPVITGCPDRAHVNHERHVCVDVTASGGNAQLLAKVQ